MTSYFNTSEINTALSNISSKLSEKACVANLYPLLKKATSSSEEATPGYVFQVDHLYIANDLMIKVKYV